MIEYDIDSLSADGAQESPATFIPIVCSQCGNDMNVEPHREDCRALAYITALAGGSA